jgi:hypothetical protein
MDAEPLITKNNAEISETKRKTQPEPKAAAEVWRAIVGDAPQQLRKLSVCS